MHPRVLRDADRHGIAFIHQELNLFSNLSVAENIFLNSFPRRWGMIDRGALNNLTHELLGRVGLDLSGDLPMERLSAGERQLVEFAKALSRDARILILDEPTTSLTTRETAHLFALLERLKADGMTMIYISHALNDVLRLCDDIAVLRDGEVVETGPRDAFDGERMISLMVGRRIEQLFPDRSSAATEEAVLDVRKVSQPGIVKGISFVLHRGEILGLSGLMGCGRTELARILFGLDPQSEGEILLAGQPIQTLSTRERIRLGMALLTESRRDEGLCLESSVADNLALVTAPSYSGERLGWMRQRALSGAVQEMRGRIHLTPTARDEQPVKTLSGGNQQKVVLGKWLLNKPQVFVLDEPTRGIDVGARYEVYSLMNDLAAGGAGMLVISSEIEELVGLCHRILVMNRGEITDEIHSDEFDRERILRSSLRDGHLPEH